MPQKVWTKNLEDSLPQIMWTKNPEDSLPQIVWTINLEDSLPQIVWSIKLEDSLPQIVWSINLDVSLPQIVWTINLEDSLPQIHSMERSINSDWFIETFIMVVCEKNFFSSVNIWCAKDDWIFFLKDNHYKTIHELVRIDRSSNRVI